MKEGSFTHTVPPGTAPDRLDRYLTMVVPGLSRSKAQRIIIDGRVRLNGRPVKKPSHRLFPGAGLSVELPPPEESSELKPQSIPLQILHEDEFLLVLDKPAGLVVHPGAGHSDGTLVNALLAHAPKLSGRGGPFRPGLVHRLDKDTSGLMVVAKSDETHWKLSQQFAGRDVLRVYLAIVRGRVQRDEGTISAPIGRHPVQRQKMAVRHDSERDAVTRYKVLKRFRDASLLELYPQTGRTHQLRVHLASIGHPILGDREYGVAGGFSRQALHAHRLGFRHPGIEQYVEFTSPLPPELQKALERLQSTQLNQPKQYAISQLRSEAAASGAGRMTPTQIQREIDAVRRSRRSHRSPRHR